MKKCEWSKIITGIVCAICGGYAIWSGIRYFQLCELAIANNATMPDAALPIAGVTGLLGSILGYLTYQGVLKNSLNKNQLTKVGSGIISAIQENNLGEMVDQCNEDSTEGLDE